MISCYNIAVWFTEYSKYSKMQTPIKNIKISFIFKNKTKKMGKKIQFQSKDILVN